MDEPRSRAASAALVGARYVFPAVLLATGIALVLVRASDEAVGLGVGLSMAALVVLLLNAFMRAGLRSQRDRDREEDARRHYDRYGRWPADD
jgi:hypothetical protein